MPWGPCTPKLGLVLQGQAGLGWGVVWGEPPLLYLLLWGENGILIIFPLLRRIPLLLLPAAHGEGLAAAVCLYLLIQRAGPMGRGLVQML